MSFSVEQKTGWAPGVPPETPRVGGRITRFIGVALLRLLGWRVAGEFPRAPQLVMAAAPHTSNWDFVLSMLVAIAYNVRISYLMKKEAFVWPVAGFFKLLGGIPIDRSAAADTVEQMVTQFAQQEKLWIVITPEGTRAKVDKWKTGFLRIAEQAQVPVCLVSWDYPSRILHVGPCWETTGNHEDDAEAIQRYVTAHYRGRYPENQ